MNYLKLLEESYEENSNFDNEEETRYSYLSSYIFDFTTYDSNVDKLFVTTALEVCEAVSTRTTFDYIKEQSGYEKFITMCNMPFFINKLEWGTSIRGAWWDKNKYILESCGIWIDGEQRIYLEIEDWISFIEAMKQFIKNGEDDE